MARYESYKILLDTPAVTPTLGFNQFALGLAQIIKVSDPRFAIGVFGGWGSGKTTVMRAIERHVTDADGEATVVPVWFNAWRYEREEHMIVPLLDTVRDALDEWARKQPEQAPVRRTAMRAAATAGRAARAIFAGATFKVKAPSWTGGPEVGFDGSKFLAELRQGNDDEDATTPQSFYHAAFKALKEAFDAFVEGKGATAKRRIVVFVDDLDRCLPQNALQVLESMKLFFDLDGFIFVVGLDREVVEQAIEARYGNRPSLDNQSGPTIRGSEYIKKIFQVPFTLPPIALEQLDEFLATLVGPDLPTSQVKDLQEHVRPHLDYVVGVTRVNPREVKRFVNAYILQMKIRPYLDPDVVLAMQSLDFRDDWDEAYAALLAEPEAFADAMRRQLAGTAGAVEDLWPELAGVVASLTEYLTNTRAQRLLDAPLRQYIYSIESTHPVNPQLGEIYPRLGNTRRLLRDLAQLEPNGQDSNRLQDLQKELRALVNEGRSLLIIPTGKAVVDALEALSLQFPSNAAAPAEWEAWRRSTESVLDRLRAYLATVRRASTSSRSALA